MSKSRQKFSKRRGLTGYRLHLKKLEFAINEKDQKEGSIMRSAKYLLAKNDENGDYYSKLSEAIKEDYLTQVGPLSASTYSERGEDSYSLFDFYLATLREGFFFAESYAELLDRILEFVKGENTNSILYRNLSRSGEFARAFRIEEDDVLKKLNEDFALKINFKKTSRTKERFIQAYQNLVREGEEETANRILGELYENLYKRNLSSEEQRSYLKSIGLFVFSENSNEEKFSLYPLFSIFNQKNEKLSPEEILGFWRAKVGESLIKRMLGVDGSKNALSFYLNKFIKQLQENQINKLVENYLALEEKLGISYWRERRRELYEKLSRLAEKAQQIPNDPAMKDFGISSYSEYRSNFGGKIESWISNFLKQEEDIQERLEKHLEKLGRLNNFFEKNDSRIPESLFGIHSNLKETLRDALEVGGKLDIVFKEEKGRNQVNETSVALHKLYSQKLHRLRDLLYEFFQKAFREFSEKDEGEREEFQFIFDEFNLEVNEVEDKFAKKVGINVLGETRKDLEKIPQFPGTAKKRKLARYLLSPGYIQGGIEFLLEEVYQDTYENVKLEKSEQGEEKIDEITRKKLDKLVGKYTYTNSPVAMQMIEKLFSTLNLSHTYLTSARERVQKGKANEGKREKFFVSPYSRGRYSQLESERTFTFDDLAAMFQLLKIRWNEHLGNEKLKAKDLVSFLELEKIRTSLFIEFLPDSVMENISFRWGEWESDQRFREHEGAYAYYLSQKEKGPEKKNLQKITQMLLASVSGIAKLWGKEEFLERYVLQYIKSHIRTPIILNEQKRFFLTHSNNQINGNKYQTLKEVKELTKKVSSLKETSLGEENEKIPILASKYYLQFLRDSFLIGEKSLKKRFNYKMNEYSLIREDKVKVEFPFKEGARPQFKIEETKLFVSIPFEISKNKEDATRGEEKNRVLGIDVGEYGLAYAVVEYEEKDGKVKTKLIKKGFLYEPALRKIRDKFFAIQQRQRTGVFGDVSTAVKKVREQAIHALRNQVHDLVVRYHAIPVYEYSISNFETGSGRVTKIYRSVKKSDVGWENEADKMEIKNTWGLRGKNPKVIGTHLSAFGTSYVCTKCKRSLYNLEDIRIKKEDEGKFGLIRLESPEGELYGYRKTERETPQASIKNYARAPLKEFTEADLGISPEEVKRKRGDSAVFRCPFVDCGHISDADTQAAYIIALKKIAREVFDGEEDFKTLFKENLIQDTVDFDPNII